MPKKRVSPEIDLKILEGLALGITPKELSDTYNVSASYISKLKTLKGIRS